MSLAPFAWSEVQDARIGKSAVVWKDIASWSWVKDEMRVAVLKWIRFTSYRNPRLSTLASSTAACQDGDVADGEDSVRLGIVDGQHRVGALLLMAERGGWDSEARNILVDVFRTRSEKEVSDLFTEINRRVKRWNQESLDSGTQASWRSIRIASIPRCLGSKHHITFCSDGYRTSCVRSKGYCPDIVHHVSSVVCSTRAKYAVEYHTTHLL